MKDFKDVLERANEKPLLFAFEFNKRTYIMELMEWNFVFFWTEVISFR